MGAGHRDEYGVDKKKDLAGGFHGLVSSSFAADFFVGGFWSEAQRRYDASVTIL
jgi:hypothetical protein